MVKVIEFVVLLLSLKNNDQTMHLKFNVANLPGRRKYLHVALWCCFVQSLTDNHLFLFHKLLPLGVVLIVVASVIVTFRNLLVARFICVSKTLLTFVFLTCRTFPTTVGIYFFSKTKVLDKLGPVVNKQLLGQSPGFL